MAADTILAIDQHPESAEPFIQTQRGILKHGSQLHAELPTALLALPAFLSLEVIVFCVLTGRAGRAIRPAQSRYGVNADLLVGKIPNGLL